MPGKGKTDTFSDGLARMLAEVGSLRAYPDANDQVLDMIQSVLVETVRGTAQGGPPAAGGAMPMGGMQSPVPVMDGEMSRGPVPGVDLAGAVTALEREMSGTQ